MKGKAALFVQHGAPFEFTQFPLPTVEPGAILARVRRANVCGSDIRLWKNETPEEPYILGHEMVGEVYELGSGVSTDSAGEPLKVGDRITSYYYGICGRCYNCMHGMPEGCLNEGIHRAKVLGCQKPPHFLGAFAEYYYIFPDYQVFKVPDKLSDEIAAAANCALAEVFYGMHKANITLEDTVVVQGAGALGIAAIAMAREKGAATIIVVEQHPERIALAKAFGADHIIDINEFPSSKDRIGRVRQLTGRGADLVCEFAGVSQAFREGVSMVRIGGKYLIMGNIDPFGTVEIRPASLILGKRHIIPSGRYAPWALYRVLQFLVRTGDKYPWDSMISHTFKLEEIDTAFEMSAQGRVTRAALTLI